MCGKKPLSLAFTFFFFFSVWVMNFSRFTSLHKKKFVFTIMAWKCFGVSKWLFLNAFKWIEMHLETEWLTDWRWYKNGYVTETYLSTKKEILQQKTANLIEFCFFFENVRQLSYWKIKFIRKWNLIFLIKKWDLL